jgi:subtilisin family serine protease
VIQQYQNLPGLVGEVTLAGLAALQQQPEVAAIALDLPVETADLNPGYAPSRFDHAAAAGAFTLPAAQTLDGSFSSSAVFIHADAVQRDFGLNGTGINVAVLDTGVDLAHSDLGTSVVAQHCFNRNGGCPANNGAESDNAQDENGHGTHVAGIIASRGQSSPQGIASRVGLVAVRVLSRTGNGFSSDVLAGIDWVVAHQAELKVKVMNLSLGGGSYSGVCDQADANTMLYTAAVQAAGQAGITIFAAAGNNGQAEALMAPACVSGVVALGNVYDAAIGSGGWPTCTDLASAPDQVACSSNSSSELDLLAPGVQVRSTNLGGGESLKSGTSMSTPHASAVAALLLQANPNLTPVELETILKETGVPVTDQRNGRVKPRLDALAAVTRIVVGEVTSISGTVLLQGRTNHSGASIYVSEQPCNSSITGQPAAVTDAAGRFTVTVPAEGQIQCLQAVQGGYLVAQQDQPAGEIGAITLPGGDVVEDNIINILDLAAMALHYRTNDPTTDVNADGVVDIFDLTIAASNYNQRGPVTNWVAIRP